MIFSRVVAYGVINALLINYSCVLKGIDFPLVRGANNKETCVYCGKKKILLCRLFEHLLLYIFWLYLSLHFNVVQRSAISRRLFRRWALCYT